jgi:hypothetical protein
MAGGTDTGLLVRLLWFTALWLAGVSALALIALLVRAVL